MKVKSPIKHHHGYLHRYRIAVGNQKFSNRNADKEADGWHNNHNENGHQESPNAIEAIHPTTNSVEHLLIP